MSEETAFIEALKANPEDAVTRCVCADWLEERGDARGELIRVEAEMAGRPARRPARAGRGRWRVGG